MHLIGADALARGDVARRELDVVGKADDPRLDLDVELAKGAALAGADLHFEVGEERVAAQVGQKGLEVFLLAGEGRVDAFGGQDDRADDVAGGCLGEVGLTARRQFVELGEFVEITDFVRHRGLTCGCRGMGRAFSSRDK